jgi:hypothetical protein
VEFKDQVSPSLFINVIPRFANDLTSNDQIYVLLERPVLETANDSLTAQAAELRTSFNST